VFTKATIGSNSEVKNAPTFMNGTFPTIIKKRHGLEYLINTNFIFIAE